MFLPLVVVDLHAANVHQLECGFQTHQPGSFYLELHDYKRSNNSNCCDSEKETAGMKSTAVSVPINYLIRHFIV